MKKLVTIGSLLGVILLAGCGQQPIISQPPVIQSSNTTTIAVDWKTYQNEQYGFEFNYPSSWHPGLEACVTYQKDCDGVLYKIGIENDNDLGILLSGVQVIIIPTVDIQAASSFIKNKIFDGKWFSFQGDDGSAQKYLFSGDAEFEFTVKFISHASKTYIISPTFDAYDTKLDNSTYNQILSTFKFIE